MYDNVTVTVNGAVVAPERFGRYTVKGVLGRGGMGTVFLAEDPVIGREVAIKAIVHAPGSTEAMAAALKIRFEKEFRVAGTLSHPNIVTVYDVGEEGGSWFIAMERVEGKSLAALIAGGRRLAAEDICRLATQIGSALDYAHSQGIVHRDIKPANILLGRDGVPKVADFGIAKLAESESTRSGQVLGTPHYMSPEHVAGKMVQGAADQFSLAIILYELLTGSRPFPGDAAANVLYQIVHRQPPPPTERKPALPVALDPVLLKALAKEPRNRYPTCTEMANALCRALALAGEPSGPVTRLAAFASEVVAPAARGPAAEYATTHVDGSTPQPAPARKKVMSRLARPLFLAGLASAVVVTLLTFTLDRAPSRPRVDPTPLPAVPAAPAKVIQPLHVESTPEGAAIWVDADDQRLATPADITLVGQQGETLYLSLRSDGMIVAETTFVLGRDVRTRWEPGLTLRKRPTPPGQAPASTRPLGTADRPDAEDTPPPALVRTVTIAVLPPDSRVWVDGVPAADTTPVTIEVHEGTILRLEHAGYHPFERLFAAADLSAELEETTVEIALRPSSPPGTLNPDLKTIRTGAQVGETELLSSVDPVYPPEILASGLRGIGIFEVTLDPEGLVAEVKVLRGVEPAIDAAMRDAIIARRYAPVLHKGAPVNVKLTVTMPFPPPLT